MLTSAEQGSSRSTHIPLHAADAAKYSRCAGQSGLHIAYESRNQPSQLVARPRATMPIAHDEKAFQELLTDQGRNKRLLVEGDSRVSHLFLPNSTTQFDMLSNECLNILDLAQPGDTAARVAQPVATRECKKQIAAIGSLRRGAGKAAHGL